MLPIYQDFEVTDSYLLFRKQQKELRVRYIYKPEAKPGQLMQLQLDFSYVTTITKIDVQSVISLVHAQRWSNEEVKQWQAEIANCQHCLFIYLRNRASIHDAEDLVQETMLRAIQNLQRFDGRNLKGWLTNILKNLFIDSFKKKSRESCCDELSEYGYTQNIAFETFASDEYMNRINVVPEELKHVAALMMNGHTQKEIALAIKKPLGSVGAITSSLRQELDLPNGNAKLRKGKT